MLKVVVGFEPGIVKSTSFSDELAIRRTIVTSCAIFLYASCVLWTVQTSYELVLVIDMFFLFKQYFISQTKKDKTAGVSLYNVFSWG